MKNYYRLMLGRESVHAAVCFAGSFIGADFGIRQDLTNSLSQDSTAFNKWLIPIYQSQPDLHALRCTQFALV